MTTMAWDYVVSDNKSFGEAMSPPQIMTDNNSQGKSKSKNSSSTHLMLSPRLQCYKKEESRSGHDDDNGRIGHPWTNQQHNRKEGQQSKEIKSPKKKKPRHRNRRSVSFDFSKDEVISITPTNWLSPPETLWFQHEEYDTILLKINRIVARPGKFCTRGLEMFVNDPNKVHKYQADDNNHIQQHPQSSPSPEDSIMAVLDEQFSHDVDDEKIASVYKTSSAPSEFEAFQRAQQDKVEAESYLQML